MCHYKEKISKIFSPEGPHENVFLDSAVALDGPDWTNGIQIELGSNLDLVLGDLPFDQGW